MADNDGLPPDLEREFMALKEVVDRIKLLCEADPARFTFMVSAMIHHTADDTSSYLTGFGGAGDVLQGMFRRHMRELVQAGVLPRAEAMAFVLKMPAPGPGPRKADESPPVC